MRSKARNKVLTSAAARAIDALARETYGIPTFMLMENAGAAVAARALLLAPSGAVAVVCGKGNNGGDGFVAARHLLCHGRRVRVYLAAEPGDVKGEAAMNMAILRRLGARVVPLAGRGIPRLRRSLRSAALVIDALLGTGTRGAPAGLCGEAIAAINGCAKKVLAVDIPSGLDADTGAAPGACIRADATVTFIGVKRGMLRGNGPRNCGKITVAQIGFPAEARR